MVHDRTSDDRMAAAVALAESEGTALATTTAFARLGGAGGDPDEALHRARLLHRALVPLAAGRLRAAGRDGARG